MTGKSDGKNRTRPCGPKVRYGRVVRRQLPPTLHLRSLFSYDPKTGSLRFKTGRYAGKEAGHPDKAGYKRVMVDGIAYQVHRLIWKMCAWKDPEHEIDHRNGNKGDNSWLNLRPATLLQNGKNRSLQKNNKSGFKGVSWHKKTGKWAASITADGGRLYLGYFDDPVDAASAYRIAATLHHGSFTRALS